MFRVPAKYIRYIFLFLACGPRTSIAEIKLVESGSNLTEYVGFQSPTSIGTNLLWTLPAADGTNGYVLQTNGSGILSWANPATSVTASVAPSFFVHKNGTDQTISASSNVLLNWSTESFDTNNNFASNRYTPTVAGKYLIFLQVRCATSSTDCRAAIYKNGVVTYEGVALHNDTVITVSTTAVVDMNGTSDYLEGYVYSSSTTVIGAATQTYFSGALLAPLASGSVAGSGTANYVPMWSSSTNLANSPIAVSGANVGIGITAPGRMLDVNGDFGTYGAQQIYTRYSAGSDTYAATYSWNSLQLGNNGPNYLIAGHSAAGGDWRFIVNNTNRVKHGVTAHNGLEAMSILSGGNVGLNNSNPQTRLDVEGTIRATTQSVPSGGAGTEILYASGSGYVQAYNRTGSAWLPLVVQGSVVSVNNNSDARLKNEIHDLDSGLGLDAILRLRPVSYHWKDFQADKRHGEQFGLIAQETREVLPHIVTSMGDTTITYKNGRKENVPDILGVNYNGLIIPLVKAIKDLFWRWTDDSAELHAKLVKQQKEIEELRARLQRLENSRTSASR